MGHPQRQLQILSDIPRGGRPRDDSVGLLQRSRARAMAHPQGKSRSLTAIREKRAYDPNTRKTGACWGPRHWVRDDSEQEQSAPS